MNFYSKVGLLFANWYVHLDVNMLKMLMFSFLNEAICMAAKCKLNEFRSRIKQPAMQWEQFRLG
jgi:hypothetical protein